MKNMYKGFAIIAAVLAVVSCEKFLERPTEDGYNVDNFYKNDLQCEQGVNYLYNSPWYDFQRGFIKIGEVMSGNMYWGDSPYLSFTTNGTDVDLVNMSYSLWAVNGHANTVIHNIQNAKGPSEAAKRKYIGEALVWKAFAYFFMVRTFGAVPIIHDNSELLSSGGYNTVKKVDREGVYEYIIYTIETAMNMLPKQTSGWNQRIDYYGAEALLAKVYLTKAGLSGQLSNDDLTKAAQYAKDVIDHSGRTLTPVFSDVFRLAPSVYNATGESLISWQWTVTGEQWTRQNTLQSDLAMVGFDENGDVWGGWGGPSVDLQEAFGVKPTDDPALRIAEKDTRRKATMMMPGDVYDYFWTDKGGFDFLRFIYDKDDYGAGGPGGHMQCQTGANNVKHLYGDNADHKAAVGVPAARMANQLPTHLIRLSDVYLMYAEAKFLTNGADEALVYVNKVRERAGADKLDAITYDDIWKERRLELAGEGDRWYDYVRRSYYDMQYCIDELKSQHRSTYYGLDDLYMGYYETEVWNKKHQLDNVGYPGINVDNPNVTASSFQLPFPTEDVVFNGNMASDAVPEHVENIREAYPYNF
ncbi:MAG: RagB/SusD family nutrient uptake outer membrane protein [Candidatus Cryptobacteroides sp.]|nr:RagB/SusD family nutrient uptake outer membrane protein [Candidatus Cryptobacteroides sp.]